MTQPLFRSIYSEKATAAPAPASFGASFGLTGPLDAVSKTWNHFSADPWTVMSTDNKPLVTFSGINLTLVRIPSNLGVPGTDTYTLVWTVKAMGFSLSCNTDTIPSGRFPTFSIFWMNSQGGVVAQSDVFVSVSCGENDLQFYSLNLQQDVFNDVVSVNIVPVPDTRYVPC